MSSHLNKAFSDFDHEGSGTLSKSQLRSALIEMGGHELPGEMVDQIIGAADYDAEGNVDYKVFVDTQLKLMTQ